MNSRFGIFKDNLMEYLDNIRDERRDKYPIVNNINLDLSQIQQRILVCMLDYDTACREQRGVTFHSNVQEMFQLIKQLIRLNLIVDVCGNSAIRAMKIIDKEKYDYILGYGCVYREAIKKHNKALKILYMTENPYNYSIKMERKRIDYFCKRNGFRPPISRSGQFFLPEDESCSDIIITLGNKNKIDYKKIPRYSLYPTALIANNWVTFYECKCKTNFLIFGAGGIIHKGIDILFEVFCKHPDWNLYICGDGVTSQLRELKYNLPDNVIDCGFVDVHSVKFKELASICFFTLSLSCSEGTSTGIMTCMCHGLLPIISRECNLNEFNDFCLFFEDYNIDEVEKKIFFSINENDKDLVTKSKNMQDKMRRVCSLSEYSRNLYDIFRIIIDL